MREDASKEVQISRAREAGAGSTDSNREWADHHVLAQERDLRSYHRQAPDLLKQQQETNLLTTGCHDVNHYTKQHQSLKNEYALEQFNYDGLKNEPVNLRKKTLKSMKRNLPSLAHIAEAKDSNRQAKLNPWRKLSNQII